MSQGNHTSTTYRDSHLGKGETYDASFRRRPLRAAMWRVERRILSGILHRHLGGSPRRYLDFACGTGRVLTYLEPFAGESFGVDVSPSMLAVSRAKARRATLVEADLTRVPEAVSGPFDLITAFRFFPNAEPTLRDEVLRELRRRLAPDGLLVFNNHNNRESLRHKAGRALRLGGRTGATHAELAAHVAAAGFRLLEAHPIGLVPFRLPPVDLARRDPGDLPAYARLSEDVIYVVAP